MNRPHVLLSVATSLDGHVDDASPERLILSGAEDLDRVDAERAAADAILVGAATIAADDPRLLVRSAARSAERVTRGLPPSPIKVAITRSGRGLDPSAKFFTTGDGEKLVYALVAAPAARPTAVAPAAPVAPAAAPRPRPATPPGRARHRRSLRPTCPPCWPTSPSAGSPGSWSRAAPARPRRSSPRGWSTSCRSWSRRWSSATRPPRAWPPPPVDRMELVDLRRVGDCALLVYRPRLP